MLLFLLSCCTCQGGVRVNLLHCHYYAFVMIFCINVQRNFRFIFVVFLVSCSTWQGGVRANGAELSGFTASCGAPMLYRVNSATTFSLMIIIIMDLAKTKASADA